MEVICIHPNLEAAGTLIYVFDAFFWIVVDHGTDVRDLEPRARRGNPAAAGVEAAAVRSVLLPCGGAGKVRRITCVF